MPMRLTCADCAERGTTWRVRASAGPHHVEFDGSIASRPSASTASCSSSPSCSRADARAADHARAARSVVGDRFDQRCRARRRSTRDDLIDSQPRRSHARMSSTPTRSDDRGDEPADARRDHRSEPQARRGRAPGMVADRAHAWSVAQERSSADLSFDFVTPELVLAARVYGLGPVEAAQAARLAIAGPGQLTAMAGTVESHVRAGDGDRGRRRDRARSRARIPRQPVISSSVRPRWRHARRPAPWMVSLRRLRRSASGSSVASGSASSAWFGFAFRLIVVHAVRAVDRHGIRRRARAAARCIPLAVGDHRRARSQRGCAGWPALDVGRRTRAARRPGGRRDRHVRRAVETTRDVVMRAWPAITRRRAYGASG